METRSKTKKKCNINQNILCGNKECSTCFNRSFASYNSKTYTDTLKKECFNNTKITPIYIKKDSIKKYLFNCDECMNNFTSSLYNITILDLWCPYCSEGNIW